MNDLVLIQDDDVFTDSMIISNGTKNEHRAIVSLIKKYKVQFNSIGNIRFRHLKCRNSQGGRPSKIYLLNEQQATFLITLLNNNKIVVEFKLELVKQFFTMRQLLMQRQTQDWQETRRIGKLVRREETDMLKKLVDYAKKQGSSNCKMLYLNYTKLTNKIAGVKCREAADVMQLNNLSLIENIIINCVHEGIVNCKHYKTIYQDCKSRLSQFAQIAYLGQQNKNNAHLWRDGRYQGTI